MKVWLALITLVFVFCTTEISAEIILPPDFDMTLAGSQPTSFYYYSEDGDFIGQGQEVFLTPDDGNFQLNSNFDNGITVSTPGLITSYSVNFSAPFDEVLTPGLYEDATRWPFQNSSTPGLSIFGDGRGCNTLTGQFEISEIAFDDSGNPIAIDAIFEQHCEGGTPALFGRIRFNASPSVVPEPSGTFPLLAILMLSVRRRNRFAS